MNGQMPVQQKKISVTSTTLKNWVVVEPFPCLNIKEKGGLTM